MRILSIPSLCDSHFCFLGAAWAFPTCLTETITAPPRSYLQSEAGHSSAVFSTTYTAGPSSHLQTGGCLAWRLGKGLRFSAIYGHVIPVKQCSVALHQGQVQEWAVAMSFVTWDSAPSVLLSSPWRLLFIPQSCHTVITAEARHTSRTILLEKKTAHPNRALWL